MKATIATLIIAAIALPLAFAQDEGADGAKKKKQPDPEKVFKKKDTDSDGFVSKDEFTKGAKDPEKAAKAFASKDKDGDGKLTLAEFTAKGGGAKKKAGGKKKNK